MHDLDDLLLGSNRLDELRTGRLVGDPVHELLHDLEIDVSFQKSRPDFAQALLHVGFGQHTANTKPPKGSAKPLLEIVEHRKSDPGHQSLRINKYTQGADSWQRVVMR